MHAKKVKGNIREFKACVEKVRVELDEAIIDMYAHLDVL
jgi:hypothetical protein